MQDTEENETDLISLLFPLEIHRLLVFNSLEPIEPSWYQNITKSSEFATAEDRPKPVPPVEAQRSDERRMKVLQFGLIAECGTFE